MAKNLWLSLKKDKVTAEIYYNGQLVTTISVNDMNMTKKAIINIDMTPGSSFKILKTLNNDEIDEKNYNDEIYNK